MTFDPSWFRMRELATAYAIDINRRPAVGEDLWAYPPLQQPYPEELRVVRECWAHGKSLGLALPSYPKTIVQFVVVPPSVRAGGATKRRRDGVIEMRFAAGQGLESLRHVAYHEIAHVDQLARDVWLTLDESESEAEMRAWNMMAAWSAKKERPW